MSKTKRYTVKLKIRMLLLLLVVVVVLSCGRAQVSNRPRNKLLVMLSPSKKNGPMTISCEQHVHVSITLMLSWRLTAPDDTDMPTSNSRDVKFSLISEDNMT
jgi:hypothetical protein